jgi:hypothetical protein
MSKQFTIFSLMILLIAFSISACNAPEGPVETPVAPDVIPETGISRRGNACTHFTGVGSGSSR